MLIISAAGGEAFSGINWNARQTSLTHWQDYDKLPEPRPGAKERKWPLRPSWKIRKNAATL